MERKCKVCGYEGKEVWHDNVCDICHTWLLDLTIRFAKLELKEVGLEC